MQDTFEPRLTKVEQSVVALQGDLRNVAADVTEQTREQREFRLEWRKQKESEHQAAIEKAKADVENQQKRAESTRLTLPQIIAMVAAIVSSTAIVLGGLMYMINSVAGNVRAEVIAQNQQVAYQVRTATETIPVTQAALQVLQRDMASDRVELGLVKQMSNSAARQLQGMENYDALLARHDEQLKALQKEIRDIAARLPRP